MQLTSLFTTAVWASVAAAAGTPAQPGALKMDFSVLRGNSRSDVQKNRRAELVPRSGESGSAKLELLNDQTYYSAKLMIGSQQQVSEVLVDTGSSDLWIMNAGYYCGEYEIWKRSEMIDMSALEKSMRGFKGGEKNDRNGKPERKRDAVTSAGSLAARGATTTATSTEVACVVTAENALNTGASDSLVFNTSAPYFGILYADNSYAHGFWGNDIVTFNDHSIRVSLAIVNNTNNDFGVLGIGLPGLETTNLDESRYTYENFPMRLKSEGIIEKTLYSLYLNKEDASSGSVLFGAVDHAKYTGELRTVPLLNLYEEIFDNPVRFDIALDKVTLRTGSENTTVLESTMPALLDSGSTLSYFPDEMLEAFAASLNAKMDEDLEFYHVSCDHKSSSSQVSFDFSGIEIKVPLSDLIIASGNQCYLGVLGGDYWLEYTGPYALLGDNFLRNAYVVFDLEDSEVSLAQANYTDDEDIEVVLSSVPSASAAAAYSSTSVASNTKTSSSASRISSSRSTTGPSASTTSSSASTTSSSASTTSSSASSTSPSGARVNGAARASVTGSIAALILGICAFIAL